VGLDVSKLKSRIKTLETRIGFLRRGLQTPTTLHELQEAQRELGDSDSDTGLYGQLRVFERLTELSSNTEQHADASSYGITSSFDMQHKMLKDEYNANVRSAFDGIERVVLQSVIAKKITLTEELNTVKQQLSDIEMLLTAYNKGTLDPEDARFSKDAALHLSKVYSAASSNAIVKAAEAVFK